MKSFISIIGADVHCVIQIKNKISDEAFIWPLRQRFQSNYVDAPVHTQKRSPVEFY